MKGFGSGKAWALLGFAWASGVAAQELITLHVNDRPPYTVVAADGSISGLTASLAENVFRAAGVPFRWAQTPLKRQFVVVQRGAGLDCAVGLLRNPDREKSGKYSKPLYHDRAFVGLVRPDLKLAPSVKAADLIANPGLRLLLKDGLTYGQKIASLVASLRPNAQVVVVESPLMLRMIVADRADWMVATEEEAGYLVAVAGLSPKQIDVVRFSDVPEGEYRYLYCSKKVPDAIMDRLNAMIPELN